MFPLLPLPLCTPLTSDSAALGWYALLGKDEQEEADRLANQHAFRLYNKTLKQLTAAEALRVNDLTKDEFAA